MAKITKTSPSNFKVSVGKKSKDGFNNPVAALQWGVQKAMAEDSRARELCAGKSLYSQVGIIFGADVREEYFNPSEGN